MPQYYRLSITPEFRTVIQHDERGVVKLAHMLGITSYTSLSKIIGKRSFPGTPQNRQRLTELAKLVGFDGEVFRGK